MKKLLALLLALTCIFSIVSCAGNNNGNGANQGGDELDPADIPALLELYAGYLAVSAPTKSDVSSTITESTNVLVSTSTLTVGKVGSKAASKLVTNTQTFSAIESGMLNLINESPAEEWYLEGKGTSDSKGRRWDSEGANFAPVAGSLYLDLTADNFTSVTYNKNSGELVLVCSADKAAAVIGNYLPGDYDHCYETTVTLTAFGDKITGIKISYSIEDREIGDDIDSSVYIENTTVEINAVYSYGLQTIDFNGYKG